MKEYWCIYRITNNINGKTYIGQHKYRDENNPMYGYYGSGVYLQRAYKKYGKENFSTEILYKRIQYKETADSMEIWAIEKERKENVNGCYNLANGGGGSKGVSPSEETRRKWSKIRKGKPAWNKGKKMSEDFREKCSKRQKGKTPCKGRKSTEESKKKMSKSHKGRKHFNNGVISVMTYECPEGFVPGRIYRRKKENE